MRIDELNAVLRGRQMVWGLRGLSTPMARDGAFV
jgi:hypothetical protein